MAVRILTGDNSRTIRILNWLTNMHWQREKSMREISAADITDRDPTFCCPLVGMYRCERERRGCYCHELHLINQRDAEIRRRQTAIDILLEDCTSA